MISWLMCSSKKYDQVYIFLLLITLVPAQGLTQTFFTISGTVVDELTADPIAGAQIFLNGTTIGTTSTPDGRYILNGIPEGIFELVVSFIGFESANTTINTSKLSPELHFILVEKTYQLNQIIVKPDPKRWKQDLDLFNDYFLGTGPFSSDTKILNPEVLTFYYNDNERIFTATANDRLTIENKALGYTIYYLLEHFELNYATSSNSFAGRPFFVPMISRRKRVNSRWHQNRKTAYYGSFQHFTQSLIDGKSETNGFIVRAEEQRDEKRYLTKQPLSTSSYFSQYDSTTYMLKFKNFLNVTYENEYEDPSYLLSIQSVFDSHPRQLVQYQNSIVTIVQDSILIDKSGYIHNPLAIYCGGYWGFEKISDLLPLEYTVTE